MPPKPPKHIHTLVNGEQPKIILCYNGADAMDISCKSAWG